MEGGSLTLGADDRDADQVLFGADLTAPAFKRGMFSGNMLVAQ
ncbi:hypothetical protein [Bradyrhizobium genosp. P]